MSPPPSGSPMSPPTPNVAGMVEILLFHHAGGLTPGVTAFADDLRAAGHTVHTPDLFEGRTFGAVEDGVAYAQSLPDGELEARAGAAAAGLPDNIVYAGMSMGCVRATVQLLARPGARAALFLYGAVTPAWFDATWPDGLPAQSHQMTDDPWRDADDDSAFVDDVPGGELFLYPGTGHLFLDRDHPDHDAEAAALATERVLEFLGTL